MIRTGQKAPEGSKRAPRPGTRYGEGPPRQAKRRLRLLRKRKNLPKTMKNYDFLENLMKNEEKL